MDKSCSKCEARLPYSAFQVRKGTADGLYTYCKLCMLAQNRAYRIRNREQLRMTRAVKRAHDIEAVKAKAKERYRTHRADILAANEKYRLKNLSRRKAYNAEWQKHNADRLRPYYAEKTRRRFARLRSATPLWANLPAIRAIYETCARVSKETGVPHHVDHQVPLVHPLVCGLHVEWNLQVIPASANLAKSNSF